MSEENEGPDFMGDQERVSDVSDVGSRGPDLHGHKGLYFDSFDDSFGYLEAVTFPDRGKARAHIAKEVGVEFTIESKVV